MQTELPKVTQIPTECRDKFDFHRLATESDSLTSKLIDDIVKFNYPTNSMEISTDDFDTYANKEATIEL